MAFIRPVQTAPTDTVIDETTGEVIQYIEHYAQGDRRYRIVHDIAPTVQNEDATNTPYRTFQTADLVKVLMEEGYWEAARAWIVEHGLLDLVLATKEFDETNANFVAGRAALQEALGLTDEQIEELLVRAAE